MNSSDIERINPEVWQSILAAKFRKAWREAMERGCSARIVKESLKAELEALGGEK